MEIKSSSILPFPRELVFRTYRDKLPELLPYLPNVERIEVKNREEVAPGVVTMENHWYAKADIPKVAQGVIRPDMLRWIDRARWNETDWSTEWSFETFFLKEYIRCSGRNFYTEPAPGKTEMHIVGDLAIDLARMPGVPRFLAGTIQPQVEKFIRMLITPNLTTVNRGLEEYLKKQSGH